MIDMKRLMTVEVRGAGFPDETFIGRYVVVVNVRDLEDDDENVNFQSIFRGTIDGPEIIELMRSLVRTGYEMVMKRLAMPFESYCEIITLNNDPTKTVDLDQKELEWDTPTS